jgi:adenosylmethionine-8-amino-7-oxononanoate aminotransferase
MKNSAIHNSPIWRPFTQMKTAPDPLSVKRGSGAWLELADGTQILDCISSWWVTLHGHSEPSIAEAIYTQAKELEHVIFAGFTHEPAERLAHSILSVVPQNLKRVFFSDNGSTAVEVALKMAYQYWLNKGKPQRNRFIGFDHGYHGDTIGAMSMGGSSGFWKPFEQLLFEVESVPYPATFDRDPNVSIKEDESIRHLNALLERAPDQYAAIIIEPLVQGAAGMHMCRPEFLVALEKVAKHYGVLLIFDEVMTGFGRTGDWFASVKSGTHPDLLCLSKGISGGFLPLALTLATEEIYEAFLDDDLHRAFFHSHSYTGNPIACAAANASFSLLLERQDLFRQMESLHRDAINRYIAHNPLFEKIRTCGTIAAFDCTIGSGTNYFSEIAQRLKKRFVERGLLLRPLASTIYLLPPFCVTKSELDQAYRTISEVCAQFEVNSTATL